MTLFLTTLVCPVRSSAFRRQVSVFQPDRLKAELQTRTVSNCAIAKGGRS
jgi:hypothetical protein